MKLNKSKTYLLPYIDKYIKIKFINKLKNTYVFLNDEYKICLRYEYSGKKEFTDYEKELENNEYYDRTIDINKQEVLYAFNVPIELLEAIDLFLSGKISYMPEKEVMISFLVKNFDLKQDSELIKIINRDESYKRKLELELNVNIPNGLDLTSIPDVENENFKYQEN